MSNRLINLGWGVLGVVLLIVGLSWLGNMSNAQTIDCTPARAAAGKCQLSAQAATTVAPATTVATTVPSTQASSTTMAPTTSATTTTQHACVEHEMQKNEKYLVKAGCNVKGDIRVGNSESGPWTVLYDSDPKTGVLLSCNSDCWVWAEFGANVSPRTVDDLTNEMKTSGCSNGCTTVNVVTWPTSQSTSPSTSAPTSTSATTTTSAPNCDASIPKGQKMLVRAGCVVTGDIAVADSENGKFRPLFDSDQNTGLVVKLTRDMWVMAPWGASTNGGTIDDNVDALKAVGCGLPHGCVSVNVVTL